MGRQARMVAAGEPHHVTQRGNRREDEPLSPLPRPEWLTDWAACLRAEDPAACKVLRKRRGGNRRDSLWGGEDDRVLARFRRCTMRNCPIGRDSFLGKLERRLGRRLRPLPIGRPNKDRTDANGAAK